MTTVRDTEQKIDSFVAKLEESARILDELAEIQTQFGNLLEQREIIQEEWNTLTAEVQSVLKGLRQTQDQSRRQIFDLQPAQSQEIEKLNIRLKTLEQVIQDIGSKWQADQSTLRETLQEDIGNGLASTQDEISGFANLLKQFRVSLETTKEAIEKSKLENQGREKVLQQKLETSLSSEIGLLTDDVSKKIDGIKALLEEKGQHEQELFTNLDIKIKKLTQLVGEIEERITRTGEEPDELIGQLKKQVSTQRTLVIALIIITTIFSCLSIVNFVFWLLYR